MAKLVAVLAITSCLLVACAPSDPPDEAERDVVLAFQDVVGANVLPERTEYFEGWSKWSLFAAAGTETDRRWIVKVSGEEGVEEWEFNMPRTAGPYLLPRNSGALITAILFFCTGRSDPSLTCESYFETLDALVEAIG